MDRPDSLSILHDQGIRYLRSLGRDWHEGQPRDLDRQPFWYDAQGYPEMLDIDDSRLDRLYLAPRNGLGQSSLYGNGL